MRIAKCKELSSNRVISEPIFSTIDLALVHAKCKRSSELASRISDALELLPSNADFPSLSPLELFASVSTSFIVTADITSPALSSLCSLNVTELSFMSYRSVEVA